MIFIEDEISDANRGRVRRVLYTTSLSILLKRAFSALFDSFTTLHNELGEAFSVVGVDL